MEMEVTIWWQQTDKKNKKSFYEDSEDINKTAIESVSEKQQKVKLKE